MRGARVLFVGGYPKGSVTNQPFGLNTLSGKRLRGMVERFPFEVVHYIDLWIDRLQEKEARLWPEAEKFLLEHQEGGFHIVALGRHVQKAISKHMAIEFVSLPHPAARRKVDLCTLEDGIAKLSKAIQE